MLNMLSLSGPNALILMLIHVITWSVVNVTASINDFRLEEVCLPSFDVVNCLLK